MNLDKLKEPFYPEDIEWRVQASGEKDGKVWARVLAYVTNRAIMDRLDAAVGPANWMNEYQKAPDGGVMCGLSIKIAGEWVTKWDGAENTNIEGVKGGLSGAMKRAAVQWGIGRYLYKLEAGFANIDPAGAHSDKLKNGNWFRWNPLPLPEWAVPLPDHIKIKKILESVEDGIPLFTEEEKQPFRDMVTKIGYSNTLAAVELALAKKKEKKA